MKRLLLVLLPGLMLSACFQVREPEAPTTASGRTSPTTVDLLLTNFKQAVTTLNTANYAKCLDDQRFTFLPDPQTASAGNTVFSNWTELDEEVWMNKLNSISPKPPQNNLVLQQASPDLNYTADSVEINRTYTLTVQHQDTTYREHLFQGSLRMVLRRRQNEWYIVSWQDVRTDSNPCWSDLKARFH